MKVVLFLLMASLAFAGGQPETEVTEITFLSAPFGAGDERPAYAMAMFAKDYPNIKVNHLTVNTGDGSTMSMDALLAAGTPPNLYFDFIGRASKYLVPEYAADLKPLIGDLDKYDPKALAPYTRDGKLLGLPEPGGAQGMAINLDIMDAIGYTVPDRWTIDDFLKMAELVKQKYGNAKYATGMFAANQSGDYLINNWFAAFGAKHYAPGDYSKTIIDQKGAEVYRFFQLLVDKGYIPSGAATLNDDDYAAEWAKGNYAATAFFPSWMNGYFDTAIEQGHIKAPFRVKYVPFPRAPGVDNVPTYISSGAYIVHNTGTVADKYAAKLLEYINSAEMQTMIVKLNGNATNRLDVTEKPDSVNIAQCNAIVAAGGLQDVGLTTPFFAATRPQHYPVLQKVLNKTVTPEQGISEYAARLNEFLK